MDIIGKSETGNLLFDRLTGISICISTIRVSQCMDAPIAHPFPSTVDGKVAWNITSVILKFSTFFFYLIKINCLLTSIFNKFETHMIARLSSYKFLEEIFKIVCLPGIYIFPELPGSGYKVRVFTQNCKVFHSLRVDVGGQSEPDIYWINMSSFILNSLLAFFLSHRSLFNF